MKLGSNITILRKLKALTQEEFAEIMGVTRQTVSRWENGEVLPDLKTAISIASFFSCSVDTLLEGELGKMKGWYSDVRTVHVDDFKVACYTLISKNPERDVYSYLRHWERKVSLKERYPDSKLIGWAFGEVSEELLYSFGMHGFTAGYTLPAACDERFCEEDIEMIDIQGGDYACIRVNSTDTDIHKLIAGAYRRISEIYSTEDDVVLNGAVTLVKFEHTYEHEGKRYIEVFSRI